MGQFVFGSPALGDDDQALRHDRGQDEGGERRAGVEYLQRDHLRQQRIVSEGTGAFHRRPDSDPRGQQGRRRCAPLAEAPCRPAEERKHDVFDVQISLEDEVGDDRQAGEQHRDLRPPSPRWRALTTKGTQAEEEGSDDQHSHRIARPPDRPGGPEGSRRKGIGEKERRCPHGCADQHAEEGSQQHECHGIPKTAQFESKSGPPQQGGGDQRGQGVPRGDSRGNERGRADGEVHQEGTQSDSRPKPASEEEQGHQGDPGRRPDGSDLSPYQGQVQTGDCGSVVGRAQQEHARDLRMQTG